MKSQLLKIAFWILKKYDVKYLLLPESEIQTVVNAMVEQVENKFKTESGEFKRAQVMRAVMNQLPYVSERDIAWAIEVKIRLVN